MSVDYPPFGCAEHSLKLFPRGFGDTLHTLELLHERLCRHLSYPLYGIELTAHLPFRAAQTVVGDAEPVGLVAQMLHHLQATALLIDI